MLPLLGKPRKIPAYALIRRVASIWAKLGAEMYQKRPKKGGQQKFLAPSARKFSKRSLYLGVAFIYQKKKFEVYALIRSVAFIRVLLLLGGGLPPFLHVFCLVPL